jgi:hypothetical protein
MQSWVWRHFHFLLPADWEMLQVSRRLDAGRCLFADPQSFRFELNWRQVEAPTDLDRLLHDYAGNLAVEHGLTDLERCEVAGWQGLAATLDRQPNSRFGRYFAGERCLVELVMLWPERRDPALEAAILASFGEEPVVGGHRRWQAFGLTCWPDARLQLDTCDVKPAHIRLVYVEHERSLRTLQVERLGLVGHWLAVPVADWLRHRLPHGATAPAEETFSRSGHDIATLAAAIPGKLPFTAAWACLDAAWICPRDGRLYSVASLVPAAESRDLSPRDLAGRLLACCDSIRSLA